METHSVEDYTPLEAQHVLFELLIDLKLRSKLSAQHACILAYWSAMSGCTVDSILKLAKGPGCPHVGHYSSKFDRTCSLDLKDPDFAFISVPLFSRAEGCRVIRPIAALPPQLTLDAEIKRLEAFQTDLTSYVKDMPPVYNDHVVVTKAKPVIAVPCPFTWAAYSTPRGGQWLGCGWSAW